MRSLFSGVLAALGVFVASAGARAQTFPDHSVRVIVNFGAGGSADTIARLVGDQLQSRLGQAFVVENKTGAGGNIGAAFVAHAAPDGYTLLVTPNSFALAKAFYVDPGYDPQTDFAPVTLFGLIPDIIVTHPSLGVANIAELVALARSKPGQISYASAGFGSGNHLRTELFKGLAGIEMTHVPFRANPVAEIDVISGRVPVMFDLQLTATPHIRAGELRALATTSQQRSPLLPDVPTVNEAGYPQLTSGTWFGAYAPRGTPPAIVAKLNDAITAILKTPAMADRLAGLGVEVTPGGPDDLARLTREDLVKWAPVVTNAGIKPE